MRRKRVSSSAIRSMGYDLSSHTLELEYVSGRVYRYFDVPEDVVQALREAPSLGEFVNTAIKGVYRFAQA